jgi:hypothetical protein
MFEVESEVADTHKHGFCDIKIDNTKNSKGGLTFF